MFWKKNSKTYTDLEDKLFWYVNGFKYEEAGSKEYLPTKSDLDNLLEGELASFKQKRIAKEINETKRSLEFDETSLSLGTTQQNSKVVSIYNKQIKKHKGKLRYYGEFLEAVEAGGLREKAPEEKEDLISLINKKDGSAVTYFLNLTIENQDDVDWYKVYCNALFDLFKFFTLKRTPISDEFESGNFLEGLTHDYFLEHDMELPDEVNDYISNGQMESELNQEHFEILKKGIHKLCVTTQNEFDTLSRYLGFSDTETHTHLTYILYSKNNPKIAAIQLKVDDSELDILYKEFSQLLNEDELNTLYENAEKYRTEYIEELVEKVNKERAKRLDYENYSLDLSAYLMLASNYALDANIAGRLKGKALIQEILDHKITDSKNKSSWKTGFQPEEVDLGEFKKYLEWF